MAIDWTAINSPAPGTVVKPDTSRRTLGDLAVPVPRADPTVPASGRLRALRAAERAQMSKDDPHNTAGYPPPPHGIDPMAEHERKRRAKAAGSDPNLDTTPLHSRNLLLRFLALASADVVARAEQGRFDALTMAQAKDAATVYRALVTNEPEAKPEDQRPGETDDDYQKRLEAMVGE